MKLTHRKQSVPEIPQSAEEGGTDRRKGFDTVGFASYIVTGKLIKEIYTGYIVRKRMQGNLQQTERK